jgi:hypothetical protein
MKKTFILLLISAISQMLNAQIPSYIPKDSLVGWWPFNGNANDESGNGHNGTVYGATLTTDRTGNINSCYEFDGNSNFIDISSLLNYKYNPITISCWVNTYTLDTTNINGGRVIVGRDEFGVYYTGSLMLYNFKDGGVSNNLSYYTGNTAYFSTYQFSKLNWVNIAMTIDNTDSIIFYINGKKISNHKNSITSNAIMPFLIGAGNGPNQVGNRFFWHGKIDDIAVWGRALDSNEIKSIYNGTNSSANLNIDYSKSRIKYFPNPVKAILNIQGVQTNANYQITNAIGQTCLQGKFTEKLDVSALKSGVYFFKTETGTQRFVKE